MSEAHRLLLLSVAESFGADPLGRMLGLWLEQEALVRAAGNRELALEVASLRLARWPSVRRVEDWLAGAGPVGSEPGPGSGPAGPPPTTKQTDPPQGPAAPRGNASTAEAQKEREEESTVTEAEASSLAEDAGSDPGVILATRVLGGEVVAVRSNGDSS